MTGVTRTPLLYPSSSISRSETIVRKVLPVPLSPARQTALGSSSLPKYLVSEGCRRTCSLKETSRRLNSLSRPQRREGQSLSGGYSRSRRSWNFRNRLAHPLDLLHLP